jgi:hypothetical protein
MTGEQHDEFVHWPQYFHLYPDSTERELRDNDTSVTTFYPDRPSTDSSRWIFVAPQSSTHSLPAGSGPFVADIEVSFLPFFVLSHSRGLSFSFMRPFRPTLDSAGWSWSSQSFSILSLTESYIHMANSANPWRSRCIVTRCKWPRCGPSNSPFFTLCFR